MERTPLLPLPEGMLIDQIQLTETGLLIAVIATHPTSCCPLCSESSSSIHSSYCRRLRDVSCGGRAVQLSLTVRKFFCRNAYCPRKVFAERLPDFVEPWARATIRFCQALQSIGLTTCGKGGARLAARLGIQTSRNTILRRIMDIPDASSRSILFLGVDDFSFRRGYRFGTILVNLESHAVIDLLPDREADTSAAWMKQHPDLMVVSRDRGSNYAKAASVGAPQAVQCADRFHVVKNLTEAAQQLLARCLADIIEAYQTGISDQGEQTLQILSLEEWRPKEPEQVKKVRLARRSVRHARYQEALAYHEQGMTAKEIAQKLDLSDRTVQRWLASGTFPEAKKRRKRQNSFERFAPYVLKRWREGERNGIRLSRELLAQGAKVSERTLYRYLEVLKQVEVKIASLQRLQKFTAHTAVWLFVQDPKKLDELEREALAAFCEVSPTLSRAYDLIQDFLLMVHRREGARLDTWLAQIAVSGIAELQSFASGIEKDKDAVRAGLTWSINNGMVEGHVTKLKLIKRQMYGKAGFPLLRQRVLHAL